MILPDLKKAKIRTNEKVKTFEYKTEKKLNINNKLYYIKTYGCQMNEHDSEKISAVLESLGYNKTDHIENADFIIINTCAIRENVFNKVFGTLGNIKVLKQNNKDLVVAVCGCMSQEEHIVDLIINKYKWIDIVLGTHNIYNLPNLINKTLETKKQIIEVLSCEGDIIEGIPVKRDSNIKAWVNVMYGCDKFCTYCIVPFTRGKQRSRSKEDIIKEVITLKENGYKEVTLLGQNVNAYGKDLNINYELSDLLNDVAKTNIERIRFVTSHPWDFTKEMITVIKNNHNIMPYIHLPIQSGSNDILKKMGRRYTKDSYLDLYNSIKKEIPNCTITTDIIVGFPNETKENFEDTLSVVEECKFDGAYTFIYSPRVGTPAAEFEDNIDFTEKSERLTRLNERVNHYSKLSNEAIIGKTVPVLLEEVSRKSEKMLVGYTDTMKLINVIADKKYIGQIKEVLIKEASTWSIDGELVDN